MCLALDEQAGASISAGRSFRSRLVSSWLKPPNAASRTLNLFVNLVNLLSPARIPSRSPIHLALPKREVAMTPSTFRTTTAAPSVSLSSAKISLLPRTGMGLGSRIGAMQRLSDLGKVIRASAIDARGLGRHVLVGVIVLTFVLAGCENQGGSSGIGSRAAIGGLGGAAGGGLLAAAVGGGPTAIAAGVILGGLVGGAIGDRLDNRDRQLANQNAQRAFESAPAGQTTTWQNPDSGHSGTLTPTRTFQGANGGYCREFQQRITVAGQTQDGFGTACRQPDGQWRIVS